MNNYLMYQANEDALSAYLAMHNAASTEEARDQMACEEALALQKAECEAEDAEYANL